MRKLSFAAFCVGLLLLGGGRSAIAQDDAGKLLERMKTANPKEKPQLAKSLVGIGRKNPEPTIKAALELLKDEDGYNRKLAVYVLASLKTDPAQVASPLIDVLKDRVAGADAAAL